jgi:hypothetical protein
MEAGRMTATLRVLALALLGARGLSAQIIRGVVVEQANDVPVREVLVRLLDRDGRTVSRALSDEQGRYRLVANPGTYRIQTLRIGYRPVLSAELALKAGDEIQHTITVANLPFSLDRVTIAAQRSCGSMSDSAVASVWEQARGALTAAALNTERRTLHATIRTYEQSTDPGQRRTMREWSRVDSGYVETPWRSLSIDSLRMVGYVYQRDKVITYNAPDLDVMTSDKFVEDHCFRLVKHATNDSLIGVSFEPTRERSRVAGIRGDYWLDRRSLELRGLSFGYANVRTRGTSGAGGDMDFVRLSDGSWMIERWHIRMPVMEQHVVPSDGAPGSESRVELRVAEWRLAGSELWSVRRGRDTLWANNSVKAIVAATATSTVPATATTTATTTTPATPKTDSAVALSPVVSTAMVTEFEERRRNGIGEFITRAELEKQRARALPDILSQVRGVRISRNAGRAWVTSGRGAVTGLNERRQLPGARPREPLAACYANVWINGIQVYAGKKDEVFFDVSTISPTTIEAIEFYPSPATTPVKYSRMDSACGTLLLWTRGH